VDLPGIYSISPYSSEELVTRDFLLYGRPDAIINIVDATNIERNLYFTLQLIELSIPMVLALNFMDEMRANGNTVNIDLLSGILGLPVIPIVANRNEGIHELVDTAIAAARERSGPRKLDFCEGAVHRCIHSITHIIEDHAEHAGIPSRFAATKLVEGNDPVLEKLALDGNERHTIEHIVAEMETELGADREAAMADMRYKFIEGVVAKTVVKRKRSLERRRSVAADALLTHRILAIPVFLLIMLLVFLFSFGLIGQPLSDLLGAGIEKLTALAGSGLGAAGVNPVLCGLVVDGILTGVGTVVGFLPLIVTLFFFLSLLEDSGYMARVAFLMDKPLRRLGLSGRSVVPMILGFGCSVPAVMSTRTLASERDRRITILLTPFMSCSAKLPIYAAFTAALFPRNGALVMMLMYIIGIMVGILAALLLRRVPYFSGNSTPFVMELPNYRLPNLKTVLLLMWEKAKDFLTRAFTVIFTATVIIWFLSNFNLYFYPVEDQSQSILAAVSKVIAPLFAPLGFGFWQAAIAVIIGFMAKEATISTLAVLAGTTIEGLPQVLSGMFTPLSAFSFLIFALLYTPCVAAIAAVKREMRSGLAAAGVAVWQCLMAWVFAFIVHSAGLLLGLG
jgi:ferrous iron transport protein B